MYKVLLVDDEQIIREGISLIIDWKANDLILIGTARNGIEAYRMIVEKEPQIVITDIKMPVMDGLELIAKVKQEKPDIVFIILSGYGEFELAKEAMGFGVKHYLLKPCNEKRIIEALTEVKEELARTGEKEEFIRQIREDLEKVAPLVREQFLRDFITRRSYTKAEYQYYRDFLKLEEKPVRMVLFQPEGECGFEALFGLVRIIQDTFGAALYFNTIIKIQVLVLIPVMDDDQLLDLIYRVKKAFLFYHNFELDTVYCAAGPFENIPFMYQELQECLKYASYLEKGSIITKKDIPFGSDELTEPKISFDSTAIAIAVKSGDLPTVEAEINGLFHQLQAEKCGINIIRTYAMELFMVMIRDCRGDDLEAYLGRIKDLHELKTLEEIRAFVKKTGVELAQKNYDHIVTTNNRLVRLAIQYVQENLANEALTLKWLASEVIHVNECYLSKLFIKETGEKFSHYLTRLRMERAKELIAKCGDDRVYEVAEKVGYGNNPQYFSQLFKKYTGLAPSEYKRAL